MRNWIAALILLIFLAACAPDNSAPITNEITSSPSVSPAASATLPPNETSHNTLETSPAITPTSQPDDTRMTTQCVEILDHIPEDVGLPGVLVLYDSLLNLETGHETQLERDWYRGNQKVSPNGEKIAVSLEQNRVLLFNAGGGEIAQYDIPSELRLLPASWINQDVVVLSRGMSYYFSPFSVLLDVNSGDIVEIPNETFPDFHPLADRIGSHWYPYGYFTRSSISPDKSLIVYATYVRGNDHMVLWDLENAVEVARFDGYYNSTFPWWSPDGEYFLTSLDWEPYSAEDDLPYVGGNELVRVNTAGEIERLTYLTTAYEVSVFNHVWSPDGEQVAFWFRHESLDQLAVLDVDSGIVTNHCLRGMNPLVWSPDGKYLAVLASELEDPTDWDVTDIFIVDLENTAAYLVKQNEPGVSGWMIFDQGAIGDNVYSTSVVTESDFQIAELRASFDRVLPTEEMITEFDFDLIVEELRTFFESGLDFTLEEDASGFLVSQLDPPIFFYKPSINEIVPLEDVRDQLGIVNTYHILLSNWGYCHENDENIDSLGIRLYEMETNEKSLDLTDGFFSDIDFFQERVLEFEEIPFGDWSGLYLFSHSFYPCKNNDKLDYSYRLNMTVSNYYVEMSLGFDKETSRDDQRELILSLAELIANLLEQNWLN